MFRLLKGVQKLEYAESFLRGDLYMNTLASFWKNGNESQRDWFEGVAADANPMELTGLPASFRKMQVLKAQLRSVGLGYCNVLCFAMQRFEQMGNNVAALSPGDQDDFGDYLVVVDDFSEFLHRFKRIADFNHFKYAYGPIEYRKPALADPARPLGHHVLVAADNPILIDDIAPEGVELDRDAFVKDIRFQGQMEWRIALCRDVASEEPYVLHIGDLHDIAHFIPVSALDSDLLASGIAPQSLSEEIYGGNVTREELRHRLFELGGRMVRVYATIG